MANDNWQHRSKGMRCSTCMWWVRKKSVDTLKVSAIGRCRRHAPGQNGGPGWPPVFESDWCGDHRMDEEAVVTAVPVTPSRTPGLAGMTPDQQIQKIRDAKARGEIRKV